MDLKGGVDFSNIYGKVGYVRRNLRPTHKIVLVTHTDLYVFSTCVCVCVSLCVCARARMCAGVCV